MTAKPGDKEPVCGRQEYTVTEDRPIEKERRTTVLEHHLYEKTFVVETRLVGERPLPGDPRVSLVDIIHFTRQRKLPGGNYRSEGSQSQNTYLESVLMAEHLVRESCLL